MPTQNYYLMQKYPRTGHQFIDGDISEPIAVSMEFPEFPFEGDTQNFILNQTLVQFVDYYLETVPTPGEPNKKYPDLYFLYDSPLSDLGGGVASFTRTWGLLPGFGGERIGTGSLYVRREAGTYVWTKPGKWTASDFFRIWFIDQSSLNFSDANNITLTTTEKAGGGNWTHDVTSPNYNYATIGYSVFDTLSMLWRDHTYTTAVISRTADSITVAKVPYAVSGEDYVLMRWFSRPQVKREPRQVVIPSFLYYDYWVEEINYNGGPENIPITQRWTILDAQNNETDTLTEDTDPTYAEYDAMVAAGTLICIEASNIHRWKGSVFERVTRWAKIQ